MANIERVVITFPNNTIAELSGDPQIIEQLIKILDSVELTYTSAGFELNTLTSSFTTLDEKGKK